MPSFVATALLLPLLALIVKGGAWHRRTLWLAALLAVLAAAIRAQYAPAALAMLGWLCLRLGGAPCKPAWARTHLLLAAALMCLGVGLLDAAAWDAAPFHSYWANIRYNAALPDTEIGSNMPAISYLSQRLHVRRQAPHRQAQNPQRQIRNPEGSGFIQLNQWVR